MAGSAANLSPWNWEGRLWIEAYRDIKWVNLRASPRRTDDHSVLWEGIMTNITQSKRAEAAIIASREQLQALSAHTMAVREQERTRIAREIHDDLGGNLTAIKIDLNWLAKRLDGIHPELLEKVRTASIVVDRTMEAAQQIARDLRPGVLDCGIVAAVKWQAEEFGKRMGVRCDVDCCEEDIALEPNIAIAIFRIFQEALTNISKHAHASQVLVRLQSRHDSLELEVADNGRGIDQDALLKPKSFGIRGMLERSSFLSGEFSVSRAAGGGTVVRLSVPLKADTEDKQAV
jgi:two-component system, NarL family, sensor histidine kinase UhpB